MTPEREIQLRPSTPEDCEFVLDLRRKTLRDVVARTWGAWDDARQRRYAERLVASEGTRIVQCGGDDIGVISVEEQDDALVIESIGLLPEVQGHGIGTQLIHEVCARASGRGLGVALQVQRGSKRARSLYERLGFITTAETEMSLTMTWQPTRSNGGYRVGGGKAPVRSPFRCG